MSGDLESWSARLEEDVLVSGDCSLVKSMSRVLCEEEEEGEEHVLVSGECALVRSMSRVLLVEEEEDVDELERECGDGKDEVESSGWEMKE